MCGESWADPIVDSGGSCVCAEDASPDALAAPLAYVRGAHPRSGGTGSRSIGVCRARHTCVMGCTVRTVRRHPTSHPDMLGRMVEVGLFPRAHVAMTPGAAVDGAEDEGHLRTVAWVPLDPDLPRELAVRTSADLTQRTRPH